MKKRFEVGVKLAVVLIVVFILSFFMIASTVTIYADDDGSDVNKGTKGDCNAG